MKIYLVGGAVRDELLGYPVVERDYVVVGASPEEMKSKGYIPVGKDFPVFLHPDTKEEYALARTERKSGHGYHGFEFNAAPNVSLEEDLCRRDLTINAIAKSETGEIIDPLNGQKDLKNKNLRHIGDAFQEDPVRILRVARFAARYAHLGFTIHNDTMDLMRKMVNSGEVDHLVPERIWKEFSRALEELNPQVFIEALFKCGALAVIAPRIADLFQPPVDDISAHPAIKALARASKITKSTSVRFATFLHDLNEDALDANFVQALSIPNEYRDLLRVVIQSKSVFNSAQQNTPENLLAFFTRIDAFRKPERFREALYCLEAYKSANTDELNFPQSQFLTQCLTACSSVQPTPFVKQGYKGAEIGKKIQEARITALEAIKNAEAH